CTNTLSLHDALPISPSSRRGRGGGEGHAKAESFELPETAALDALGVAAVEVVGAEFVVRRGGGQEVVADLEDVAADGDDRLAMTAVGHDAPVARAEGGRL